MTADQPTAETQAHSENLPPAEELYQQHHEHIFRFIWSRVHDAPLAEDLTSVHEYPQGVSPQPWFNEPNFPDNLPAVWDQHWGYLAKEDIAPVLIGEFGTRYETDKDRQWLQTFQEYIRQNGLNWIFWSLNPNSGDTGGLLLDDWISVHVEKQDILAQIQYPFMDFIESSNSP